MRKNLLLAAVSVILTLTAIEGLCRLFVPLASPYALPVELIVQDVRGPWILAPGFSGTMDNRVDFRDKAVNADSAGGRLVPCREAAPADARRVFLFGDSQTFGHGLADGETWANGLQCRLNRAGTAFRTYDLGIPGTNIDSYISRFRQVQASLGPGDRVIVGVTWNDLHSDPGADALQIAQRQLSERAAASGSFDAEPARPLRPLSKPTWRYRTYRSTGVFVPYFGSAKSFADSMLFSSAAFALVYPRVRELVYRYRPRDALFRKLPEGVFDRNFRLLALLGEAASRTGADFAVVLLPNRVFFDRFYYDAYSQNGQVFPEQDFLGHLAKRYCPDLGIRCVSMFPYLRTDRRDAYTYSFDGHYNEAGADRVAAGIYAELFSGGVR